MTRRTKKPSPEELEAQADELLRKDDHESIAAILEHVQAIAAGMETLKLPSNDPEYLKRLQTSDAQRAAISNKVSQIDVCRDGNKTYLGVGWFNQHHEALDVARKLAEHFEAKIRQHG